MTPDLLPVEQEKPAAIHVLFAENGNIRKWDRKPFDGSHEYRLASRPADELDATDDPGCGFFKDWDGSHLPPPDWDGGDIILVSGATIKSPKLPVRWSRVAKYQAAPSNGVIDAQAETYRDMHEIATRELGYPSILEALEACPAADARPTIDPEALERLRVLSREATPGEWEWRTDALLPHQPQWSIEPGVLIAEGTGGTPGGDKIDRANAAFMIEAVAFVRGLLGEG